MRTTTTTKPKRITIGNALVGTLVLLSLMAAGGANADSLLEGSHGSRSNGIDWVNLLIGTTGRTPNTSGGMIPSVAPPFGMTRWVAQTQVSYVSATPYNASWGLAGGAEENTEIHGFMATRQPAIWMGESGSIAVVPGVAAALGDKARTGAVNAVFAERGLRVLMHPSTRSEDGETHRRREVIQPHFYSVELDDGSNSEGTVSCEMTATSRVGQLRFSFQGADRTNTTARTQRQPYILIDVARPSIITSTPTNITYPAGYVEILVPPTGTQQRPGALEICGYSTERQDAIITPISGKEAASGFKGYFCARFDFSGSGDEGFEDQQQQQQEWVYGVVQNGTTHFGVKEMHGPLLSAFVFLPTSTAYGFDEDDERRHEEEERRPELTANVRVGTSFISIAQARANLDAEVPDGQSLEQTSEQVGKEWEDALGRVEMVVGGEDDGAARAAKEVFWTAVAHTLQYPSEQHEGKRYWSGYDGLVHEGKESYTGYSIWDTYRAAWAWQILLVPERIPGMVQSMLADYQQSGWLPMWKNIVETNIMIATHADSLIAEAVLKNITGFDLDLAWEAVWKDCTVPPARDWEVLYDDREEHVDYEARAGLSSVYDVEGKGWVADDVHSESASRTLGYAYDDYAAYVLATLLPNATTPETAAFLYDRAMAAPFTLFNPATGFVEARNADGAWAGPERGFTEGDKWAYTFDIVHNIPELVRRRGGNVGFVKSLEAHFEGGWNDHANEPSHHIPYLYAMAGAAFKTQERVREIAKANYDNTPTGLSGNEDCGQMSAWYLFSALGFYPVNPVSGEYIVGSPFFEEITLNLPDPSSRSNGPSAVISIRVRAPGARTRPYVRSVKINGVDLEAPVIKHEDLFGWGRYGTRSLDGTEDDALRKVVTIEFEMSDRVEGWGNDREVLKALGVAWPGEGSGTSEGANQRARMGSDEL